MATKLIKLEDDTLVEVEVDASIPQQISSRTMDKVASTLAIIEPVLSKACKPIVAAVHQVGKDAKVTQIEIEMGFSFEVEGSIYITGSKANANLTVKLTVDPQGKASHESSGA